MGKYVSLNDTINSFERLLSGEFDEYPEAAFLYVGDIKEVIEKAKNLNAN